MVRKVFLGACALAALALLGPAVAQQPGVWRAVYVRVLLPEEDAEVEIGGKVTRQTGKERLFVSPPLEPGRIFTYTVTATWEPNNYTKVIRSRTVRVWSGGEVSVDLRKADPKHPDRFLIRYVPTPDEVVEAMCKLARVGKNDVVFDLGCGDGRIVISAVKDFGAKRGMGLDIDPERIKDSLVNAKKAGVTDRVEFRQGDVLNLENLGEASVVMLYMGEDVNLRLRPILKRTLKPGSRIVSHDFSMGDWKAEKTIQVIDEDGVEHDLFLWTVGPNDAKNAR